MSQVIETNDKLNVARSKTRDQEHKISTEDEWAHWRRNDVTKQDMVALALGNIMLVMWLPFYGLGLLALLVCEYAFKGLGKIIGGSRSLITGRPAQRP